MVRILTTGAIDAELNLESGLNAYNGLDSMLNEGPNLVSLMWKR